MAANGHHADYLTEGINPVMMSEEKIHDVVSNQLLPQMARELWAGPITNIYFYGAGCIPEKRPVVAGVLESIYKHAKAEVESDMLGAARGLLLREAGVACILGTGSASCLYDGEQIAWNVPSLGYILGDEGSGATLGRRLVSDLMKGQVSNEMKEKFLKQYDLDIASIIEHTYRQPLANRWLAGLSRFCAENIEVPEIYRLVYRHLDDFVVRNLEAYYSDPRLGGKRRCSFVGSIAYYYREVLSEVLAAHDIEMGEVMQDPIEGLGRFYRNL